VPLISEDLTDTELVARVRAGDRDAYGLLVRRHAPVAHRTAVLLGAGADAEDVVQEALVKAYRSLGGFRADAPFRPWLLRIVANEARNAHRTASRRVGREVLAARTGGDPEIDRAADPATHAVSSARRDQLHAALLRLSEPDRLVLTCRYLLELDEGETSTVLGWPRGTVKSRLSRAMRRLRTEVGDDA